MNEETFFDVEGVMNYIAGGKTAEEAAEFFGVDLEIIEFVIQDDLEFNC